MVEPVDAIESLRALGLTGTEARLYAALSRHGALTGYEAARRAGVVRANAYAALDRLVARGAARTVPAERAVRYEAVPVATLVEERVRQLRGAAGDLEAALGRAEPASQASVGHGLEAMGQAVHAMVAGAAHSLHLATGRSAAGRLGPAVAEARSRLPEVTVACLSGCSAPCATCGRDARALPQLGQRAGLAVSADRQVLLVAESVEADAGFVIVRSDLLAAGMAALVASGAPMGAPPH